MLPSPKSFTGRVRRQKTSWRVKGSDFVASWLIKIGGIGTIVAVLTVFLFLLIEVWPLFFSAELSLRSQEKNPWRAATPIQIGVDEYQTLGWGLFPDGELQIFRIDSGEIIERRSLISGSRITAVSYTAATEQVILGLENGEVRLGRIGFQAMLRDAQDLPVSVHHLPVGESAKLADGIVQRTPQGQFRTQTVTAELTATFEIAQAAIDRLDHVSVGDSTGDLGGPGPVLVAHAADGTLHYVITKRNPVTEAWQLDEHIPLPLAGQAEGGPLKVLISGRGDNVFVVYPSGELIRFDARDTTQIRIAESTHVARGDVPLTACAFVLGRETLLCGDAQGRLDAWFRVRQSESETSDGQTLTHVHELPRGPAGVTSLGISQRSRLITAGFENGVARIYQVTTEKLIAEAPAREASPISQVLLMAKEDGLVTASATQLARYRFDPKHPEATVRSLFLPTWYEGYPRPMCVWQSSFAGVDPEMKLGLWPLVFGTLKATFYSMLFGAPLALLAAIYSSEFMSPVWRARIKPLIEMMASLPSVVLGFLAALFFAPLVENIVPSVIASIFVLPLTFVWSASLWQLLPTRTTIRLAPYRLLFLAVAFVVGLVCSAAAGPLFEKLLFAGDLMRWLNGQVGSGLGGWFVILLPLAGVATAVFVSIVLNTYLRTRCGDWSRASFAGLNFGKIVAATFAAMLLALAASWLLTQLGWLTNWLSDPRGTLVDTYVQRNSMVVGFVMGFAIIPIIYTIAEDALNTVPQHLRSASLGSGATVWQTAVRVVIPTAMSGLFSAVMVGLGRAVGETMIVLMAGGNTPVTKINIFDGFRTLSATIAVELPEAVRGGTHFRTLFLAALTLFVLTFVVNTVAEIIRLRFRKRAYQL